MIARKIIQSGYSWQLVLPKYWAEMHKLKRGDFLELEIQKDGTLIIKGVVQ